jgi:hypothetical protein
MRWGLYGHSVFSTESEENLRELSEVTGGVRSAMARGGERVKEGEYG